MPQGACIGPFHNFVGNGDMFYEVFDILKGHGVPPEQLYAGVYF